MPSIPYLLTNDLLIKTLDFTYSIWDTNLPNKFYIKNDITDAECSVITNNNYIHVIFKQTDSSTDVNYSLRFFKETVDYKDLRFSLHTGFWEQFISIWHEVFDEICKRLNEDTNLNITNIIISGFSLGGALAQIMTYIMENDKSIPFEMQFNTFLFNSPRVSDTGFLESINNKMCHIMYKNDPVPSLPPAICCFNDQENIIYIKDQNELPVYNSRGCLRGTFALLNVIFYRICCCLGIQDNIDDHHLINIINYINNHNTIDILGPISSNMN